MSEKIEINARSADLDLSCQNREEALRYLAGLLAKQGFIDAGYVSKVIEREKSYPTALQFESIAIAIPHGDAESVSISSIAIGRCREKMLFHSMEDPTETINVDMIVLLAVKDPKKHMIVLNNLMEMFAKRDICKRLLSETDAEAVCQIFRESLYQ